MNLNLDVKLNCRNLIDDEIIEKILQNRGVKNIDHFLNPNEEDLLSCDTLMNIDKAASIVLNGIKNHLKFFVHVDSDNDGISAGAIMYSYLKEQGINPDWYVSQGKQHGTSNELIQKLNKVKPNVLIIVDSLDANIENYELIKNMGVDVIVLDHHDIREDILYDNVVTLVSSNRNYKNKDLCGAGVTWKFCCYLDSLLGTWDAEQFVDLACSGTLSDMMNMDEMHMENREIVNLGLDNINNLALKKIIGGYEPDSRSIIFSVAPLVNASCRYSKNDDAFLAFISNDNKEVLQHLKVLKDCKKKQEQDIKKYMPDLIKQADKQINNKVIYVVLEGEHGLSGLIANKLLDKYGRPIFVLCERETGYSGSCRSVGINDFRQICADTGLINCAGHAEAFGVISINYSDFDNFKAVLEQKLKNIQPSMDIVVDAEIGIYELNDAFINKVKNIDRITGTGFGGLTFMLKTDKYNVTTMSQGKHLVFNLEDGKKLIQWNKGYLIEDYELHDVLCDELTFIGTLDKGFLGRDYSCRMICDKIL